MLSELEDVSRSACRMQHVCETVNIAAEPQQKNQEEFNYFTVFGLSTLLWYLFIPQNWMGVIPTALSNLILAVVGAQQLQIPVSCKFHHFSFPTARIISWSASIFTVSHVLKPEWQQ